MIDPLQDVALFDIEAPPPVTLADRFVVPPFSVLDRRSGLWQDRKDKWLSMGFQSEIGRSQESGFLNAAKDGRGGKLEARIKACGGAVSVFDPVLCELAYRWFSPVNGYVLDPFAGGSVRGIVAGTLGRHYTGIDLRQEQVDANHKQMLECEATHFPYGVPPEWLCGPSQDLLHLAEPESYDFIFSCPPYADLEVYSDDPNDLSNMPYPKFMALYQDIIAGACEALKPDRFAAWVISDIRDKRTGNYRGLVYDTVSAFEACGLHLYNDMVTVDAVGSGALLAARQFDSGRKVRRMHQHMLVFAKGDNRKAAKAVTDGPLDA